MRLILFLFSSTFLFLFPSQSEAQVYTRGPANGWLVLAGGGEDSIAFAKFIELAGGPDAQIVFIPTAAGDEYIDSWVPRYIENKIKQHDLTSTSVLHTRNPDEANSDDFVSTIQNADAVWMSGGRQWRLADSYLNTRTLDELKSLLARGGVIGGTSAGATIQGSYLFRGDTKTNTILMGDHEEGFGFISHVAVDQHLLARNRQFDLFELLNEQPELLGIGLDEGTAIVVQASILEVIGESYVAIYDGTRYSEDLMKAKKLSPGEKEFYFLQAGDFYDMEQRRTVGGRFVPIRIQQLEKYTGRYSSDDAVFTFKSNGSALIFKYGDTSIELDHGGHHYFFSNDSPDRFTFKADESGKFNSVVYRGSGGYDLILTRVVE